MHAHSLAELLATGRVIVIDGGLATQLEAQGCVINNRLWSASMIRSNPQAIVAAHRAFLDAGAEIIITASYQTVDPALVARSVELAVIARDEFRRDNPDAGPTLIAGSVGPYGASLANGSEYTGDYGATRETIREFHRERIMQLAASDADVLACETIPSRDEALALAELLSDTSAEAWVSFSCRDEAHVCDGTPIRDVAAMLNDHPQVLAIGINCSNPKYVSGLIREVAAAAPAKAVIVYPNSGEDYDPSDKTWSGLETPLDWAQAARDWSAAGARIIGGCCRTGPEHIRAISGCL